MKRLVYQVLPAVLLVCIAVVSVSARDLQQIREEGVLRHLGVPYASFVTGNGDGLDVEVMKLFAAHLGVRYEYVTTGWGSVISDLIGKKVTVSGGNAILGEPTEIKGDVIANGLTVLPWRQQVLDYSRPTFPTQVWLVAAAHSALLPIQPTSEINADISRTKQLLSGKSVLGVAGTCLDPSLYQLNEIPVETRAFGGNLNELAPAVLNGAAETALLDVPDSLVALAKWPGQIKILGPISDEQQMAVGFRKESPELQQAFGTFIDDLWKRGIYRDLVKKYYPDVFDYYPAFFN